MQGFGFGVPECLHFEWPGDGSRRRCLQHQGGHYKDIKTIASSCKSNDGMYKAFATRHMTF